MSNVCVLEPDRVVEWVRAWAELEWPVSWETAFAVRDRLGWVPKSGDGCLFATGLSGGEEGDGFISSFEGAVGGVSVPLSSLVPAGERTEDSAALMRAAFEADVAALTAVLGAGQGEVSERRRAVRWVLPNRVTVEIGGMSSMVSLYVDSPEETALDELEDYYVEKYGEAYFEGEDV